MQRLVVLISGEGSNMVALAKACRQQAWKAEIVAVVSNKPAALGLARAQAMGLDTQVLAGMPTESREAYDQRLANLLQGLKPDWVLLAGFMRILSASFVSLFEGRLVNIHPSLLPLYPGLHTHQRVLAGGDRQHGATVHFVTAQLDAGPTIAQERLDVLPGETLQSLEARVLELEHRLYPQAVKQLLEQTS